MDFDRSGFDTAVHGSSSGPEVTATTLAQTDTTAAGTSTTSEGSSSSDASSSSSSSGDASSSSSTGAGPFLPFENADPLIVASGAQNSPSVTAAHTVLVYEQVVPSTDTWQLMRVTRDSPDEPWGAPAAASSEYQPPEFADPSVTASGDAVIMTRVSGSLDRPVRAPLQGATIGKPEAYAQDVSPGQSISTPNLRGNDLELTFSRGNVHRDFYISSRPDTMAEFAGAMELPQFNSDADEQRLWLSAETGPTELAVFSRFVAGRGFDLFYWQAGDAEPTSMPLNTDDSEFDPWLSADRSTLYFVRDGGDGGHIWIATAP